MPIRITATNANEHSAMDTRPFAITVSSLEALILDRSRWWYREEDDLIEDIVYSIERREVHNGIDVGDVAAKDVKDAYECLWSKGMLTRVTSDIAAEMVNERVTSVGVKDLCISDVLDLLIFTAIGLKEWDNWFHGYHWLWIEEDSTRWFIRGTGALSLSSICTAMKDNPQSYRCCQLGCCIEMIGPWAHESNFVMPSGWRLICNRRADGN